MSKCCCGGKTILIYPCSGAANTGEIAGQISRKLTNEGFGKMTCLASVGAHISGFVQSAKGVDENITIDGCSIACAKKILEHIGVNPTKSYILTEMGIKKGETPVTKEIIDNMTREIKDSRSCYSK
jgi:uncharacterized metal-binding protein